jgi:hypothetical protein
LNAFPAEKFRQGFHVLACHAIDDSALARPSAQIIHQFFPKISAFAFLLGNDPQILTEKGSLKPVGFDHAQLADNVRRHFPRGRRGERQNGHVAQLGL